jgi:formylglycine-generating enzyme required for sulfatase activity
MKHTQDKIVKTVTIPTPVMIELPGGTFIMGSPPEEPGRWDDETQREVTVEAFAMSETPITFEQYDAFCEATGREKPDDKGLGRGNRPVINVTWHDAKAYCEWLSKETGEEYDLPSEEEWEYAARAGTTTAYFFGDDPKDLEEYAWYNENSDNQTHPVKEKKPNPWGFYDILGNVWCWCRTEYKG